MNRLPEGYSATLPRKRMAAGVLLRDGSGRVLLVEPAYKDYWEVPGGCIEADESPYDAAVREVNEELGISITPRRLLVVDWVPPRPDRTEGVMFVYDGGIAGKELEKQIHLDHGELRSWAWSTERQTDSRLSDLLARRVSAARQALRDQATTYLENGYLRTRPRVCPCRNPKASNRYLPQIIKHQKPSQARKGSTEADPSSVK